MANNAFLSAMGDPPKKEARKKASKKVTLTPHTGDEHDRRVTEVVQPIANVMGEYVRSPLYLQRLKGMRVENPEAVQAARVAQLNEVRPTSVREGSEHLLYYGGKPILEANKDSSRYTLIHELGHTFTEKGEAVKAAGGSPFTASGRGMSSVEGWAFVNRSNLSPALKKAAFRAYQAAGAHGNYSNDPVMAVKPAGMDEHGVSTKEMKGDLEALRLILLDSGITTKYGETLTDEHIKKFKERPDLHKEEHVERLLKNFSPEALKDLNNKIASRKPQTSNLA